MGHGTRNPRRARRIARSAKYAPVEAGRLYRVTRAGSAFAGRHGIAETIAPDTGTVVVRISGARLAFAPWELSPFDDTLAR